MFSPLYRIIIVTVSVIFIIGSSAPAEDHGEKWSPDSYVNVVIDVVTDDGREIQPDTLVVGGFYKMRIFIENNFRVLAMTTGYRMWSDEGVLWKYSAREEGHGETYASVTVNPESRMWPVDSVFDMVKILLVFEYKIDLIGADTIFIGGAAMHKGLPIGPLEHMLSWHFRITGPDAPGIAGEFCLDSSKFTDALPFRFCDNFGNDIIPEWGGQVCLPVKAMCGNVNGDLNVDVGDAIFMLNSIFKHGPYLTPLELCDVNCDGQANVGDAVYLLNYIFKFGPEPCCM